MMRCHMRCTKIGASLLPAPLVFLDQIAQGMLLICVRFGVTPRKFSARESVRCENSWVREFMREKDKQPRPQRHGLA
ncbi:hypothetical protein C8R47DRAFT_170792 [Mycena vitilis]|nr:hypothetical protein C8R47DRAFT_170792 [Mycena vitilis]